MLLYYIRHGAPIYDPDSLTPLGHRQAESVGRRIAHYGVDRIYTSTSNRAILTAQPACELLGLQAEQLDFANEGHVWRELTVQIENGRTWLFHHAPSRRIMASAQMLALGHRWYEHPAFAQPCYQPQEYRSGMERVRRETAAFLEGLGYRQEETGYTRTQKGPERVALFAHQGFGLAFLSAVLDIPYPLICNHFDMTHTGVTVIRFEEVGEDGFVLPEVLTLSSDAHLYRDGLPMRYHGVLPY